MIVMKDDAELDTYSPSDNETKVKTRLLSGELGICNMVHTEDERNRSNSHFIDTVFVIKKETYETWYKGSEQPMKRRQECFSSGHGSDGERVGESPPPSLVTPPMNQQI
jgi:hypothetical protein